MNDDLLELLPKLIDPIVRYMNKYLATALALIGAVVAFFVQKKQKRRQRIVNQRMESKLDAIMERLGVEWVAPSLTSYSQVSATRSKYPFISLLVEYITALIAGVFIKFRIGGKRMKNYLKKLGKTKFQAFLLMTATNIVMLIMFFNGSLDLDAEVEKYMPIVNITTQMVVTWIYVWVEGSIDKANVQGGRGNDSDFKTPIEPRS